MLYLFIYLADIANTLRNSLIAGSVVLSLVAAMAFCGFMTATADDEDDEKAFMKVLLFFKKFYITMAICFILGLFVPSKFALYQIAGVYCGKQISQQMNIDKKLQKVSEIIDLQLNKNIEELRKGE